MVERWRCRPDGSHRWTRLDVSPGGARKLRGRAREAGVSVDAWLAIALGLRSALAGADSVDRLLRLQEALIAEPIRPAADRRLRGWQRYLWERDSPSLVDELPEVVLSSSTCDRSVSVDVASAFEVDAAEWDLGRECEIRAAALATPMPSYIRALTAG